MHQLNRIRGWCWSWVWRISFKRSIFQPSSSYHLATKFKAAYFLMSLNALGKEQIFRTHAYGWASLSSIQQPFAPLPIQCRHHTEMRRTSDIMRCCITSKIMAPFLTPFKENRRWFSSEHSRSIGCKAQTWQSWERKQEMLTCAGFTVEAFFQPV